MRAPVIQAALLTVLIAGAPAVAEESSLPPQTGAQGEAPEISSARLAAGVREYPARVLRSLLQVAEDPLVLRQLADEPELLERPEEISPPVPANLHAAIRELSVMPAIVTVSADYPTELKALRELYAQAPEEMEEYVLQLRAAYNHDEFGATVAWQEALERDPAALEEYRKLVTRFCEAQREAYQDYPCVQVREREYYYACPPNEAIIFYAIEHEELAKVLQVIGQWWETYAPYELDARILDGGRGPIEFEIGSDTVAAMPPEQRASMWRAPGQGYADSGDLVPVIMQPPADQPAEARYARAVAEQARLWTPEMPVEAPAEPLGDVSDVPMDQWSFGDEGATVVYDDWPYPEEPLHELIYDDDWDYASNWAYGLGTYGRVRYGSYHTYYSPIVVYYRGYPFDWPLFYGCDPWWLLRSRMCVTYIRCGHGYDPYGSYRPGWRTGVCYGSRHWGGGDYDGWWHRGHRNFVRVGRRCYHRCSEKQIAGVLPHRKTYHGRGYDDLKRGGKHSGLASLYGLSPASRKGSWQGSHNKHSYAADIARTRKALADAKSRAGLRDLLSGRTSAREHTKRGLRPGAFSPAKRTAIPKRGAAGNVGKQSSSSGRLLRPSASGRKPSHGSDRASRSRPTGSRAKTVAPRRSSSSSGSLRSSPRPQSSSKPRSVGSSRRSGTSGRSSGISSRRSSGSKSKSTVVPRRSGSSRRSPGVSSGRSSGSKSKSAVVPRRSSTSRGSLRSSPRPQSSSKPRSVGSSRRSGSSSRSSGVSSRRSSGSKSKSTVVPRRSGSSRRSSGVSSGRSSGSSRRSSGVSSRRSSGSRSKTTVAPRRSGSSHRSPRVSSRPQSSSKPRSIGSSRRSSASHRGSSISSRRSTSPKSKAVAPSRQGKSSRRAPSGPARRR